LGVIMFWNEDPSDHGSNVWIYKHSGSSGGGDTTSPSTPTALRDTATTASSVELTWTASTDNIGLAGYKIFQNNIQVGASFDPSFNATGLAANTSYSFQVLAYDAAGNTSPLSTAITATTSGGGRQTTALTVTASGGGGQTTAVTVPTNGQVYTFTQKCAMSGVLHCNDFDDQSELRYHWPSAKQSGADAWAEDICDNALASTHPNYYFDPKA